MFEQSRATLFVPAQRLFVRYSASRVFLKVDVGPGAPQNRFASSARWAFANFVENFPSPHASCAAV